MINQSKMTELKENAPLFIAIFLINISRDWVFLFLYIYTWQNIIIDMLERPD